MYGGQKNAELGKKLTAYFLTDNVVVVVMVIVSASDVEFTFWVGSSSCVQDSSKGFEHILSNFEYFCISHKGSGQSSAAIRVLL